MIPKGPKWLKHLLRRCFGVVLRVKHLIRRCRRTLKGLCIKQKLVKKSQAAQALELCASSFLLIVLDTLHVQKKVRPQLIEWFLTSVFMKRLCCLCVEQRDKPI